MTHNGKGVLDACRYQKQLKAKPATVRMFPPGRVMFMRPLKTLKKRRRNAHVVEERLEKSWDAIWVTPQELIAEGILVSKQVSAVWRWGRCMLTCHQAVSRLEVALPCPNVGGDEACVRLEHRCENEMLHFGALHSRDPSQ